MRSYKLKLPIRLIIVTVMLFLAATFVAWYLRQILRSSSYFTVKDIIIYDNNAIDLSYLKGENIFAIDLNKESRYLSEAYPNYRRISLVRILPNRLGVQCILRKPLAFVKLYRYFCIDEDSVLFDISEQLEETQLPIISGLETKIFGPKSGKKYNIKELALALNIIKEIERNRALRDYKIKIIDVQLLSNASIFISPALIASNYSADKSTTGSKYLEVKIGQEEPQTKINILANLLTQAKNDISNIKYIDLRFKEPVIKLKNK